MPNESLRFYTTEKLGPKREKTPEGFLICYDVPLARIGEQTYHYSEVPVPPAPDSPWIKILREPDEVFSPLTISSALGKPFVVLHPDTMEVNPQNWSQHVAGHIVAVRQGQGEDADVLLGDILVGRQDAIEAIENDEMREVSMGYDCSYDRIGDEASGLGRQRGIIFNHVALVREGRCGSRCSIGDHQGVPPMAKKRSMVDALASFVRAVVTGDKKAIDETSKELEELEGKTKDAKDDDEDDKDKGGVTIHNHAAGDAVPTRRTRDADEEKEEKEKEKKTEDRFLRLEDGVTRIADAVTALARQVKAGDAEGEGNKKILGELELEAPPGTTDATKMKDSAPLEVSYRNVIADADIIAPGLRVPTFDAAAKPSVGLDMICGIRRKALDFASMNSQTAGMIEQVLGNKTLDTKTASCGEVRTVFNAVVGMAKRANNSDNASHRVGDGIRRDQPTGQIKTLADLNRIGDEAKRARTHKSAA